MKIALLQYPIFYGDIDKNLQFAVEHIREVGAQADVILLPEMFSTGFVTDNPQLAEPPDGYTIKTLQNLADEQNVAIVGSFICKENDKLYNRGFFLRPMNSPIFLDKKHLYENGGEKALFTPGTARTVVEYKGVKFLLLICYDLRFPVWARNVSGSDYDIILVCANWPQVRIHYFDALVKARAIENQCYICAVNPLGEDTFGQHYNGHSVAYDTYLKPLASFQDDEVGYRIADFDVEKLHHFREVLPLWKDVDEFYLVANKDKK